MVMQRPDDIESRPPVSSTTEARRTRSRTEPERPNAATRALQSRVAAPLPPLSEVAPWRLFYDSNCAFCTTSMRRAVRWAERSGTPIVAVPLSGDEAVRKGYGADLALEADRVYLAGDAWLKLFGIAPWYLRGISLLRLTRLTRSLVARLYTVVASRRSCRIASR